MYAVIAVKTRLITKKNGDLIKFSYTPLPDGAHMMSYQDVTLRMPQQHLPHSFTQRPNNENDQTTNSDWVPQFKTPKSLSFNPHHFISHFSYELRAGLNTIQGYNDLLQSTDSTAMTERHQTYCHQIHEATTNLTQFVSDISELYMVCLGHTQLNFEPLRFGNLLKDVIGDRNHSSLSLKGIQPTSHLDALWISADQPILTKVLKLLFDQALIHGQVNKHHLEVNLKSRTIDLSLSVNRKMPKEKGQFAPHLTKSTMDNQLYQPLIEKILDLHGISIHKEMTTQKSCWQFIFPIAREQDKKPEGMAGDKQMSSAA